MPSHHRRRGSQPLSTDWVDTFEGRYFRGDEISVNTLDLIDFRCQVIVDDLADIPENLAITMGDIIISVLV